MPEATQNPNTPSDHQLEALAAAAKERSRADGATIALETDGTVTCRARVGDIAPAVGARADTGLAGHALRSRQIQRCADTERDPRVNAVVARELGVRSMVVVPIREGERLLGIVSAFYRRPNGFDEEAVRALETIAAALSDDAGPEHAELPGSEAVTIYGETAPIVEEAPTDSWFKRAVPALVVAAAVVIAGVGLLLYRVQSDGYRAAAKEPAATSPSPIAPVEEARPEQPTSTPEPPSPQVSPSPAATGNEAAAESGDPAAQVAVSKSYENAGDVVQACAWLIVAEANGNRDADAPLRQLTARMTPQQIAATRYELGRMYAAGRGVKADRETAYMWFVLAREGGNVESEQAMNILRTLMTPEQVEAANQRASDWLARHRANQ